MTKWPWLLLVALVALAGDALHGAGPAGADAARILVVIAMPAPSHLIVFTGLTRALAERGHQITLAAAVEKGNKLVPKQNHVFVSIRSAEVEEFKDNAMKTILTEEPSFLPSFIQFMKWGPMMVRNTLENPEFKAEILDKPGQKFDLVITEAFFMQESMVALGHKFNAPVVALNPFGVSPSINDVMGNPSNPSYTPNVFIGLSDRMTLLERVKNLGVSTTTRLVYQLYQIPQHQSLVEEFFPDAPPLTELLRHRLALTLVNNHFSLGYPVPMVPGVVEVGGMHISHQPKALPKDLQELMDGAKEGVVFFSMGSNVKVEYMPKEKVHAIFNALGALKQRVLIKWVGAVPDTGVPKNMKILEWAPQADILAHPNLRAFVTHGGLLSTQESVYHAVPLVGIPTFADQEFNMRLAVQKGFAEQVGFGNLTEANLSAALKAVVNNPKYKQAASRLSALFRSVPQRPADLAVFWVEHVMRHGGQHLRPASVDLPLYQVLLLDVLAVILAPLALLALLVRALCRCCCGRRGGALPEEEKKRKSKKVQ